MAETVHTLQAQWDARPGTLLYARLAEALQAEGRSDEAVSILREGLGRFPRHVAGHLLLAGISTGLGRSDDARASYESALACDSRCPAALRGLGDLLAQKQYLKQAADKYQRLSLLVPEDPEASQLASHLRSQVDLESRTTSFSDAILGESKDELADRTALGEGTAAALRPDETSPADPGTLFGGFGGTPTVGAGFGDEAFELTQPGLQIFSPAATAGGMSTELFRSPLFDEPLTQPAAVPPPPAPPSAPPRSQLVPADDESFATLEMASLPAQTIPPPPLEKPATISKDEAELVNRMGVISSGPEAAPATRGSASAAPDLGVDLDEAMGAVTGRDIGDRLDDLFGDDDAEIIAQSSGPASSAAEGIPAASPIEDAIHGADNVTGGDIEERLDELFGMGSLGLEKSEIPFDDLPSPAPSAAPAAPSAPPAPGMSQQPTGNDIAGRFDELFGGAAFSSEQEGEVEWLKSEPKPGAAAAAEATSSFLRDEGPLRGWAEAEAHDARDSQAIERNFEATIPLMPTFPAPDSSQHPTDTVPVVPVTGSLPSIHDQPVGDGEAWPARTHLVPREDEVDSQLDNLFAISEFSLEAELRESADPAETMLQPRPELGTVPPPPAPPPAFGAAASTPAAVPQPAPAIPNAPAKVVATGSDKVTGEDIGNRLDALFGLESDVPGDLGGAAEIAGVPTVTLAEEYLRQGYPDQAVAVYRQLLAANPGNDSFRERIAQIESLPPPRA